MRRIVPLILLGALGLPAVATAAPPTVAPALGVRVASCQVGATAEQRGADFEATMPADEDAERLSMRFELEQKRGTGAWKPVAKVPAGFGRTERSAEGAAGFVYGKRVERLSAGASYRVVVSFTWRGADGEVVKRATRKSLSCKQPDLRPDLTVLSVAAPEALPDGRARYVVAVRNDGSAPVVGALRVGLAVDGLALPPVALGGLGAGQVAEVLVDGPACRPGGSVVATVDATDTVEERDELDNALRAACA